MGTDSRTPTHVPTHVAADQLVGNTLNDVTSVITGTSAMITLFFTILILSISFVILPRRLAPLYLRPSATTKRQRNESRYRRRERLVHYFCCCLPTSVQSCLHLRPRPIEMSDE